MPTWSAPDRSTAVFVGSYAAAEVPGIHALLLDDRRRLRLVGTISGITNPSFLALHPDGAHLYAVSETGAGLDAESGAVVSYRLDAAGDGGIAPVLTGRVLSGGDHPCHLVVDPSGAWLVASNYGSGSFSVIPLATDGRVLDPVGTVVHRGSGHDPGRQEAPHVHSALFSPDGSHLLVADLGIDRIVVYRFDRDTGGVARAHEYDTGPGSGPRHMAFHPDGRHLFVVNELSNSLTVLRHEPTDSVLSPLDEMATVPVGAGESIAADIGLTSDGATVVVSNRGHDSIASFRFSAGTGLVAAGAAACGGSWPRGLGLSERRGCLLVANRRSHEVTVLEFDAGGAAVRGVIDRIAIREPSCVVIG